MGKSCVHIPTSCFHKTHCTCLHVKGQLVTTHCACTKYSFNALISFLPLLYIDKETQADNGHCFGMVICSLSMRYHLFRSLVLRGFLTDMLSVMVFFCVHCLSCYILALNLFLEVCVSAWTLTFRIIFGIAIFYRPPLTRNNTYSVIYVYI